MDKNKPPDPPDDSSPGTPTFSSPPVFPATPVTTANPLSQFADVVCQISNIQTRKRPVNEETVSSRPSKQIKSQVAREFYTGDDKAPFIVHVSRIEQQPNSGITLHPVSFGIFLQKNNVNNIVKDGVKRVGRNRVSVEFASPQDANSFLTSSILPKNNFIASIPSFHITRMGVVSGIPTDMTEEEAVVYLSVPPGCGRILKIRRINRKNIRDGVTEWKPTETCFITFDGQTLPKRVYCCYTSLPVEQYIFPTIQCRKCCRFGHIESICRSKPRCLKCGHDHPGNGCSVTSEESFCILCSGNHFANSKDCPDMVGRGQSRHLWQKGPYLIQKPVRLYLLLPAVMPMLLKVSYRKTVFLKPRSHTPLSPSYDRTAHGNIISSPHSTQPNGCGLSNPNTQSFTSISPIIELLIQIVKSLLSPNITSSPSNVADKLMSLLLDFKNGSTNGVSPVECEERGS